MFADQLQLNREWQSRLTVSIATALREFPQTKEQVASLSNSSFIEMVGSWVSQMAPILSQQDTLLENCRKAAVTIEGMIIRSRLISDFASPEFLDWLLPVLNGKLVEAVVIHRG